ncbi:hypothetical protein Pyrfu_1837 [Pyrolobus fumarii 1A]|uniref:Sodium/calcium exchanger membrane region domain-containing protein n=1 Tax=Pyrolobus fumarii (strain DSM 11204 / 1A) TaxID=694429 RepID=G0ECX1_PYRF1|nr:hypothetical protein [Pyrolobus fumarii]AEM39691.1 hypothetical protein Pyrfu_1837 [Pyrolobus fumarii 1A]
MNVRLLSLLLVMGFALYAAGGVVHSSIVAMGGALLLIAALGEVTVYGVEGLSARLRLSGYSSSVLVNSMAVTPELFAALALGLKGASEGNAWLTELALLSVLVSASFNLVVLGIVALRAGGVGLENDVLRIELPLMRVAVAATALLAGYAVIEASMSRGEVPTPYSLLIAQLLFWVYYLAHAVKSGLGRGEAGHVPRYWALMLVGGVLGMVWAAEGMASAVEEMLHELHIEHLGEAALAVGIASSSPEAALALIAAKKGKAREAAGGLLAATSTALLMVYPLAYIVLAGYVALDAFMVYMLAMIATLLWVAKRSLAHENMIDTSEALYITLLSAAAMATLAILR